MLYGNTPMERQQEQQDRLIQREDALAETRRFEEVPVERRPQTIENVDANGCEVAHLCHQNGSAC